MTREEKSIAIENLTAQLADVNVVYLADISGLDAGTTSDLRRACFKAGIKLEVVKNTLLAKAMEVSAVPRGSRGKRSCFQASRRFWISFAKVRPQSTPMARPKPLSRKGGCWITA